MIVKLVFSPIFAIINFVISLLPANYSLPNFYQDSVSILSKGLAFFPSDVWIIVITNIFFWLYVQFSWSLVEWVYKKIPGVD